MSQDRMNIMEPLRYALFRQWGLPIVSDKSGPLDIYPVNNTVDNLMRLLRREFERAFSYPQLEVNTFRWYVERAVNA